MPLEFFSDDSDFSETDYSIRGRHGRSAHIRRRSSSRHVRKPQVKETYLMPEPRIIRSASTGGRRQRDRSPQPHVTIINEQATRTSSANHASNKPKHRVQQRVYEPESASSSEEELSPIRKHGSRKQRHRASSGVSANIQVGASRTPSPYHRDVELAMQQRMLERSDARQDLEIFKQQQEIERLERELERHREKPDPPRDTRESRLLREEEEWYEDEISERLRRLERYERKSKDEEAARKAERSWKLSRLEQESKDEETARKAEREWRLRKLEEESKDEEASKKAEREWRMRRLEEAEKEAAEKEEVREKIRQEKLAEIAKQQEEEEERERLRKEFQEEERRKQFEEEEERKKEMAIKAAAVAEWKLEQERIKQREAEEEAKRDREFRDRLRHDLGYDEEEIEHILNKKKRDEEKKEKKEKKEKEKEKEEKHEKHEKKEEKEELYEERRTTWIKVCLPSTTSPSMSETNVIY